MITPEDIFAQFEKDIKASVPAVELKAKYLSRKSPLISLLRSLKDIEPEKRRLIGSRANKIRQDIEDTINRLDSISHNANEETIDWSKSAEAKWQVESPGHLHPLTYATRRAVEPFLRLGFYIERGPEVEFSLYNFDFLNFPPNHPARDIQDTFYVEDLREQKDSDLLLRTHTSPVQIRAMKKSRPPAYFLVPGRVYRNEATDASHGCFLHQIEGLAIDKGISLGNLLWTLDYFTKSLFGQQINIRVRPSYFPFVEPGIEIDFTCIICLGKGSNDDNKRCSVCKGKGWIEIGGAGMVHPNVLANMNVDNSIYTGFAFGLGLDRIAMLIYSIPDIRFMFENDIRFIEQF